MGTVAAVNIGRPHLVERDGELVPTSIRMHAQEGRARLSAMLNDGG